MRRPSLTSCGGLSALLALCGCTALGLDRLELRCETPRLDGGALDPAGDPCAALNALHGLDVQRDCEVYQCRRDGRGCELRPLDRDGDGVASALVCAESDDDTFDCDDLRASVAPGREETLDGLDNDCNGRVDDGVAPQPEAISLELDGAPGDVSAVALGEGAPALVLGAMREGDAQRVVGLVLDASGRASEPATVLEARSEQCVSAENPPACDVQALGYCALGELRPVARGDGMLLATIDRGGCRSGKAAFGQLVDALGPEGEVRTWELGQLVGAEACPATCLGARQMTLAAAPDGRPALAAWWQGTEEDEVAGEPYVLREATVAWGDPQPRVTRVQSIRGAGCGAEAPTVALDPAADWVAPAAVATQTPGACAGFVLAHARDDDCCAGVALRCVSAGAAPRSQPCGCLETEGAVEALAIEAVEGAVLVAFHDASGLQVERVALDAVDDGCRARAGQRTSASKQAPRGAPRWQRLPLGAGESAPRLALHWLRTCGGRGCPRAAIYSADGRRVFSPPFDFGDPVGTGTVLGDTVALEGAGDAGMVAVLASARGVELRQVFWPAPDL